MDAWSLVLQIATLLAVVVAAWQLMYHSRQMHRDFEALYIDRYWTLMDRRSPVFALGGAPTEADQVVILSYLQLCEDEIDCRRMGRVTDNTWNFWRSAIAAQASETPYAAALARTPDGHFPQLRALLVATADHDPLKSNPLSRIFHGL